MLAKRYTENSEAYQLYLKGRFHWNKRTGDGLKAGLQFFEQAIAADPAYSLAYAGLADSYLLLGVYCLQPPSEVMPKAKAAVAKALSLDDTLAEAHTSLAGILCDYEWDWQAAEKEFKRAIDLNPKYATAHHWYGIMWLVSQGRLEEALTELNRAREADPLSLIIAVDTGVALYLARRYDEAVEECKKALELDPRYWRAHVTLAWAYERKGQLDQALDAALKARDIFDDPFTVGTLGYVYAASGKKAEAQRLLDELKQLSQTRYVAPFFIAEIYVGLNEHDRALQFLEKALEDRVRWIVNITHEPRFESLRSNPRFSQLVLKMGLPK